MAQQQRIEAEINEWQNLQREMEKLKLSKQKLMTQLHENEMVKKELDLLKDDATIYKLIGPALIKQEPTAAKGTVAKRIEYLVNEMTRIEQVSKDMDAKMNEKKKVIMELQKAAAPQAGRPGAR